MPDLAGPSQIWVGSSPAGSPASPGWPKGYGLVLAARSDEDRRPSVIVVVACCMRARGTSPARVSREGCLPRASRSGEGQNRLRRGRGRQWRPQSLHAGSRVRLAGSAGVQASTATTSSSSASPVKEQGRVRSGHRGDGASMRTRSREGEERSTVTFSLADDLPEGSGSPATDSTRLHDGEAL
jgi:hypothetical protein